jgi:hypothetical protein
MTEAEAVYCFQINLFSQAGKASGKYCMRKAALKLTKRCSAVAITTAACYTMRVVSKNMKLANGSCSKAHPCIFTGYLRVVKAAAVV